MRIVVVRLSGKRKSSGQFASRDTTVFVGVRGSRGSDYVYIVTKGALVETHEALSDIDEE